ncbi:NAD(P)-dependent oxidoreductase [Jatrophihabitans telluris]|uniref:NAD(P)-dependent oxidoreductase n=1 Tax=Jatrophihabitans telluris TaxID=2038343 RepID=A0ABY4R1R5_9ACTN|nr:NAD(P)-dependent oxidoreductase [Jatrophihabitans telluris]UQX88974.1 NAD(P)-dependent oxidoreductase [Jatrophihabitans telluris]
MIASVGFIGLGVMGSAMSGNLLDAGIDVIGFDLDESCRDRFVARGGRLAASPAEIASTVSVVLTSLPSEQALDSVLSADEGLLAGARADLIILETSTLSASRKLAAQVEAAAAGVVLLDCPMSGTGQQAVTGDLVAYLSGDDDSAKRTALTVLAYFTRSQYDLGSGANGTRVKLVANHLVAVHNAAAAEALLLAERAGLDLQQVITAVGDGAGSSRMFQVRGPMMASGRFMPAAMRVDTFSKDLALIAELAAEVAAPTPLLESAAELYRMAAEQGRGGEDTACVYAVLDRVAPHTSPTRPPRP